MIVASESAALLENERVNVNTTLPLLMLKAALPVNAAPSKLRQ